jgi:KUP system potassium uptake protein
VLFFVLQLVLGDRPRWQVIALGLFFLSIVLSFLGANLVKVLEGGWLPVGIGVVLFTIMTTWHRGRELTNAQRARLEGDLREFVEHLHDEDIAVLRVPGCAVFLSRGEGKVPMAMRAMVEHTHCLHKSAILLTIQTTATPRVAADDRVAVADLGYSDDGISHVVARLGYLDRPSIPTLLRGAVDKGLEATADDIDSASYFLSVPRIQVTKAAGMARRRKLLYRTTSRLTADPVEFFDLPRESTIVMGTELEI